MTGEGQKGTPTNKGTGRKTSENVMTNRSPSLPTPFCQRRPPPPLPWMSSEVQKKRELAKEVRGPKDKTNGHERGARVMTFSVPSPSRRPLLTFTEMNTLRSNYAVFPRVGRPKCHSRCSLASHFGICVADNAFRGGNVSMLHVQKTTKDPEIQG